MLGSPAPQSPIRIGIYRTSSFGDVVLATATLDLLSQLPFPTDITWIGRGASLDIIKNAWPTVKCLKVEKDDSVFEMQKLVDTLKSLHCFIDLQCNLKSKSLGLALKATHRIPTFSAHKSQMMRTRLIVDARLRGRRKPLYQDPTHLMTRQFETMCRPLREALTACLPAEFTLGLDYLKPQPRLPIPPGADAPWLKELKIGTWLAIAPGAAHKTKQAPVSKVIKILESVRDNPLILNSNLGIVVFGDQNDRQAGAEVLDALNWKGPTLNLAGRLSLWETAIGLHHVTCILSNDSSLAHIAEAVKTPSAVLFGPTVESFGFAPRMAESRAFSEPIGCRPCSKHGKTPCRYDDNLCFETIRPHIVADFLVKRIQSPQSKRVSTAIPSHLRPEAP